ncbi:Limonene 1,2-monooxygenase [Micromonospora sp. MW-13]|uniref:LLM class flavin-dependent oxidoreductase n=1 Tax=unclassified Micromonospora TaxID=2617518 RepID=UPI000E44A968|nr:MULTISPECIES: LLM class flavin-dependent oxidoreductase [unclassified Micromonospora]MCX4472656.1 LLM class flavin-dependent oxidoreductase [Micromonospora sp. NBC_01655]RGC69346.1 Limonene 1,2-monooxygenase [Micromonospora sp. MW-13]
MKLGLLFDLRNPAQWERPWADHYARTLEFCEEADRLGIGGLWFTEHHRFEDGYLPQPLTFAAAAAARTKHARIGTSVVIPALRKPAQLAEEAAIVDLISGGRLELGIGAGYRIPEFELFDVSYERQVTRAGEAVTEVRRLWSEQVVTPLPIQNPVPIWGGFYRPRGARMAGRLGMGYLDVSLPMFEHYLAGLEEAGHDASQARVAGLLPIVLADDPEAAWARIVPHLAHQKNTYRQGWSEGTDRPKLPWLEPDPTSEELRKMLEVLTPDQAAERIRALTKDLPVEHLIFWASIGGMPDDLVVRNIELFTEKLGPLLA